MAIGRRTIWIGVSLLVVVAAGWFLFQRYWYYLPSIVESIRNPIHANHEVVWQKGPASNPVPVDQ